MKLILDSGGDPRAQSNAGETAMAAAVSALVQASAKVQLLADRGLDVNVRDRHGVSPLMLARAWGWRDPDLVPLLLKLGADVQLRDDQGRTADDYLPMAIRVPSVPQNPAPTRKRGG
jgi:ankyrin repeat protein